MQPARIERAAGTPLRPPRLKRNKLPMPHVSELQRKPANHAGAGLIGGANRAQPLWIAPARAALRGGKRIPASRGFTLTEVVISLAIIALVFGGILMAYVQAARKAEWSGYSLAAQAIGIHQIEQARSAVWDYSIDKNELTNLNLNGWSYNKITRTGKGWTSRVLDIPRSGTNVVVATNFVTVKLLSVTGLTNVHVHMVMVDTVWRFPMGNSTRLFTNQTASYFGPDNRDVSSL